MQLFVNINSWNTVGYSFLEQQWVYCAFRYTSLAYHIRQFSSTSCYVLPRLTNLFASVAPGPWQLDNLSALNAEGQLVSVCLHLCAPVVSTKVMLELCVVSFPCFHPEVLGLPCSLCRKDYGGEAIVTSTFVFLTVLLKGYEVGTQLQDCATVVLKRKQRTKTQS